MMDEKRDRGSEPFARTPTSTCQASRRPYGVRTALASSLVFAGLIGASLVWIGVAVADHEGKDPKVEYPCYTGSKKEIKCDEVIHYVCKIPPGQTTSRSVTFKVLGDCHCSLHNFSQEFQTVETNLREGPRKGDARFNAENAGIAKAVYEGPFAPPGGTGSSLLPPLGDSIQIKLNFEFSVLVPAPGAEPNSEPPVICYTGSAIKEWADALKGAASKWKNVW